MLIIAFSIKFFKLIKSLSEVEFESKHFITRLFPKYSMVDFPP